jgi:transposase
VKKSISKRTRERFVVDTVAIDLGDELSQFCALDREGRCVITGQVRTNREELKCWVERLRPERVVIEAGTHSPWVSRYLCSLGWRVVVANPRKVALIFRNRKKRDRVDAESLARLGRSDETLLSPIFHRAEQTQLDLAVIRSRDAAVRCRTMLINHVRGIVKSVGGRLPACSAAAFGPKLLSAVPTLLRVALEPLLEQCQLLTQRVRQYDRELDRIASERYPETARFRQVKGVGPITALAYRLLIETPGRFSRSRNVGAYFGLVPASAESGELSPQLRITKEGDALMRRLLVSAAQYILGPFGPDSDLRRSGLAIAARGGKNAKKRATVAVARKLAVLLHRLWITDQPYVALYKLKQVA